VSDREEIHIAGVESRIQYRAVCSECAWLGGWTWPVAEAEEERLAHDLDRHEDQLLGRG
jgi:hypothetical protein